MAKAQLVITVKVIRSGPVKWGYCRACNARIEWVKTEKGRLMPVDWPLHPLREFERRDGTFITEIDALDLALRHVSQRGRVPQAEAQCRFEGGQEPLP